MKDVVVRSVANGEELRQANEIMARAQGESHAAARGWLALFGEEYPGYRREHTRIALSCGSVVAALRLTTDTIRLGEARLKMGGLGWVATDRAWKRKGIVSRLMTDTMHYMQEQRYHVSMLFGTPEFYRRWGFAPTLAEYAVTLDLPGGESDAWAAPFKMRFAKPGDIQAMQKMHSANDADTACSLIRTQAHLSNKWRQWERVRVLTDARGKVAAYFRGFRLDSVYVIDEVGVADNGACAGVLSAATRLARQEGALGLRLHAPPGHPMVLHLLNCHAHEAFDIDHRCNGMMAFANLGEALESMIPEWESRLVESAPALAHAEVTLMVGRTGWRVRAHHGALDVSPGAGNNKIALSAHELVQLTVGCLDLEEVLGAKRHLVGPEGVSLLHAMFPRRVPYVWALDRF